MRNELKALDSYLQIHSSVSDDAKLLFHTPGYGELLSSSFNTYSQDHHVWMNSSYEQNPNHAEQLTHRTISGHVVRSKSEAIIDYALYMNHIPFRYECALTLGDITLYPDFTIKHPRTGQIYYWEHFGLMDEPAYYKSAYSKLQLYTSHKIIPTIQLITTFETRAHPLDSETVDTIINNFFF